VINSCSYHPIDPKPPCDTCCDTCHKPCDTCQTPCDTCPKAADTTSHNFTWTEMTIPTETTINNVWVFGPTDIWCSGSSLYHCDGTAWSPPLLFQAQSRKVGGLGGGALFGLSDGSFWMCDGSIVEHCFPATKTAIEYRPNIFGGFLHACWGTSSNNMYFVSDKGVILHFDGTNWTKMESGTTKNLHRIWGTSSNDIWACDYDFSNGQTSLVHYDGAVWSTDPLSMISAGQTGGFLSVWGADSSGHHINFTAGSSVYRKTDNSPWTVIDSLHNPGKLPDGTFDGMFVCGSKSNDLTVAGSFGLAAHWNGASWRRYDQFLDINNASYFPRQISTKDSTVCIAGTKDGGSWILLGQRN
jgi:hypothetical protein